MVEAEIVLSAAGVVPNTSHMGLEEVGGHEQGQDYGR